MPKKTKIGWTDATWNPLLGCTKVSEGCRNCYAERVAFAQKSHGTHGYYNIVKDTAKGPRWTGEIQVMPERMEYPLRWKAPRMIFVCSMSDLFHPKVSDATIQAVFDVMEKAHWHQFQVLTKRPERMIGRKFPPNVWAGTSVESVKTVDRLKHLSKVDADIRYISAEPLLEDIATPLAEHLSFIDWVIVGGESGPNFREMDYAWVHNIYLECKNADVRWFFKQWSGRKPKQGEFFIKTPGDCEALLVENEFPISGFPPPTKVNRVDTTSQQTLLF